MQEEKLIVDVFVSIDKKSVDEFISFLDESCSFRFGNLPTVIGAKAVKDFVGGFFDSIDSLQHELTELLAISGGFVCHGTVSYTRHDKSVLTVPFSNIFKIKEGLIVEYLIFADTSQLYSYSSA